VVGHEALREQVLREIEEEAALAQAEADAEAESEANTGGTGGAMEEGKNE
jgi:hypothetical protein